MILNALDSAGIKAMFFVTTRGMDSQRGELLLKSWDQRGHKIANHTYSHPFFNSEEVNTKDFSTELLKADDLIRTYDNYVKFFRFPYLKEGNTAAKVDRMRHILKSNGYRNGYVTIDASDWYIDQRLKSRLKENPHASIEGFKKFYLEHLLDRATYYEQLSQELTGRHINHTLLLHHNLASALFLDDLIQKFESEGWEVTSAHEAYKDPIFEQTPNHAGESLIWALAKDAGVYEDRLRYPAEDSRYEKARMDQLGL